MHQESMSRRRQLAVLDEWQRKKQMANYSRRWVANSCECIPVELGAVHAMESLLAGKIGKQRSKGRKLSGNSRLKLPNAYMTKDRQGNRRVHVNSLRNSCSSDTANAHRLDEIPWEKRVVKQRFLHDQSVSFSRNWFGILLPARANVVVAQPVCRAKSMPMPVETDDYDDLESYEDGYNGHVVSPRCHSPSKMLDRKPPSPRSCLQHDPRDDFMWFENAPECGKIRNTHLRVGEPLSRVTPELTCSLSRSRWRKKHFARGRFPYPS